MEVPHIHHITHKKKWTEYLLDFFMLFLAVFLGFVAENFREHKADREKEKVYISNLYEDLIADTVIYSNYLKDNKEFSSRIDTLMQLMKSPDRDRHLAKIYLLARLLTTHTFSVIPDQRTFSQLEHSGLLRLIINQKVASEISSYYLDLDLILGHNNFVLEQLTEYLKESGNVFDAETMYHIRQDEKVPSDAKLALITEDKVVINRFLSALQYLYGSRLLHNKLVLERLQDATALLALIKQEYHLEKK
ncbi:hypothetical protein OCK74_17955 [Chitinophagaceae bacterium LB-8]|uniref:Uncharacterized protein n=1 Tax=Paraflavisolibacter caeni TaxID=2982496 RepID=A0A9X2XPD1_9BACT|nr:hypothetical protein [Paraflavisolibacter caeni]MCU7551008.1 hypothetical protein [Paraflavisolibacter caeni]